MVSRRRLYGTRLQAEPASRSLSSRAASWLPDEALPRHAETHGRFNSLTRSDSRAVQVVFSVLRSRFGIKTHRFGWNTGFAQNPQPLFEVVRYFGCYVSVFSGCVASSSDRRMCITTHAAGFCDSIIAVSRKPETSLMIAALLRDTAARFRFHRVDGNGNRGLFRDFRDDGRRGEVLLRAKPVPPRTRGFAPDVEDVRACSVVSSRARCGRRVEPLPAVGEAIRGDVDDTITGGRTDVKRAIRELPRERGHEVRVSENATSRDAMVATCRMRHTFTSRVCRVPS